MSGLSKLLAGYTNCKKVNNKTEQVNKQEDNEERREESKSMKELVQDGAQKRLAGKTAGQV